MATVTRTKIASLSTGIEYPLTSGILVRTTHGTGRTEWEVVAKSRGPYVLTQDLSYQLYIVADHGQSYVGTALLQNQTVRHGTEWTHRFVGTGVLGEGLPMPAPEPTRLHRLPGGRSDCEIQRPCHAPNKRHARRVDYSEVAWP